MSLRSRSDSYCSVCERLKRKRNSLSHEEREHSLEHTLSYEHDKHRLDFNHHHHHTHEDWMDHDHHHHDHEPHHHHHHHNHERWSILPWPIGGRREDYNAPEHKEKIEIIVKQQPAIEPGPSSGQPVPPVVRQYVQQPPQTIVVQQPQPGRKGSEEQKKLDDIEARQQRLEQEQWKLKKEQQILDERRRQDIVDNRRTGREDGYYNDNRDRERGRNRRSDDQGHPDKINRAIGDDLAVPGQRQGPGTGPTGRGMMSSDYVTEKYTKVEERQNNSENPDPRKRSRRKSEGTDPEDERVPAVSSGFRQNPRIESGTRDSWVNDPDNPNADVEQRKGNDPRTGPADDVCYNCKQGRFVKKFTWTGIICCLFCFPCAGTYFCFKFRTNVCSYCGIDKVETK